MAVAGTGNAYANDGVLKAKRELAKYVIDHGSANAENQTRLVTASCYNGKYMGIIYKTDLSDKVNAMVYGPKDDKEMDDFFVSVMDSINSTNLREMNCISSGKPCP